MFGAARTGKNEAAHRGKKGNAGNWKYGYIVKEMI
jgi:hypothetical protein